MQTTLSSKGQLVLPAEVRRKLRLGHGEKLSVELRDDGVFLKPSSNSGGYVTEKHPVSGLPVMKSARKSERKVTAEQIAQLNAELL